MGVCEAENEKVGIPARDKKTIIAVVCGVMALCVKSTLNEQCAKGGNGRN